MFRDGYFAYKDETKKVLTGIFEEIYELRDESGNIDIEIPEGVEVIETGTFEHFGFNTVTLPSSLKTIMDNAFQYTDINKVIFKPGPTEIGNSAFGSAGVKEVVLSDTITRIGCWTFSCSDIEKIYPLDHIKEIDIYAFEQSNLKELILPENIESIGKSAFTHCDELKSVEYKCSCNIPPALFKHCRELENVVISGRPAEIGAQAFLGIIIKNIDLPDSLKLIGHSAFHSVPLRTVTIPKSVEVMKDSVFYDCTDLEEIIFDNPLLTIGSNEFTRTKIPNIIFPKNTRFTGETCREMPKLKSVTFTGPVEKIPANFARLSHTLENITFKDNIGIIGENAFKETSVTKLILNNVNEIRPQAFSYCAILKELLVGPNTIVYDDAFSHTFNLKQAILKTDIGANEIFGSMEDLDVNIISTVQDPDTFSIYYKNNIAKEKPLQEELEDLLEENIISFKDMCKINKLFEER